MFRCLIEKIRENKLPRKLALIIAFLIFQLHESLLNIQNGILTSENTTSVDAENKAASEQLQTVVEMHEQMLNNIRNRHDRVIITSFSSSARINFENSYSRWQFSGETTIRMLATVSRRAACAFVVAANHRKSTKSPEFALLVVT